MNNFLRWADQPEARAKKLVGRAAGDNCLGSAIRFLSVVIALQLLMVSWPPSALSVMASSQPSTLEQESPVQEALNPDNDLFGHPIFLPLVRAGSGNTISNCDQSLLTPGQPLLCNDIMPPLPELELGAMPAQVLDHKLAVFYAIPADIPFDPLVLQELVNASREIQAWYQVGTGGVTWEFAFPEVVQVYYAKQPRQYYVDNGNWWNSLLPEMNQAGLPVWTAGTIAAVWAQGAGWFAGGAQLCGVDCGVALLGVELMPKFDNPAFSGQECPDADGRGVEAFPCVAVGAFVHELGHTLGLPHPFDFPETVGVSAHSVMHTHWNYPDQASDHELPWGFLRSERQTLRANPFMKRDILLHQTYEALNTAVNLPPEGTLPSAAFDVEVNGNQVSFHNHTQGATHDYWTFGDTGVSNAASPIHTYLAPGSYTAILRASSDTAMMSVVSRTLVIAGTDLIFADNFESGDLSQWSRVQTGGGDLKVRRGAALVGSHGLRAKIDDNSPIYVIDEQPSAEPRYRARFYFDPNSLRMTKDDNHLIFLGYSGTSQGVLRLQFRWHDGHYQLRPGLLNDGTTWTMSRWRTISDAKHLVELEWQAATAPDARNGFLTFWIDGRQRAKVSGIDNDTRRIDWIKLGAASGIDAGTRGTYFFDAFESRRQSYIGPAASSQASSAEALKMQTDVVEAVMEVEDGATETEEDTMEIEEATPETEEGTGETLYLPLMQAR